jgi:hypothetical protein
LCVAPHSRSTGLDAEAPLFLRGGHC